MHRAADYSVRIWESSGSICLPQARSTNSSTQLPFIPRQVRGQFLKHCWTQQRWCTGLIFLDLLIQPVSLAFRGESGQEALNEPREAQCDLHGWGLKPLTIISRVLMDKPTGMFFVHLPNHFGWRDNATGGEWHIVPDSLVCSHFEGTIYFRDYHVNLTQP